MPLEFDQYSSLEEGKEVSKLMEFLCTCINLIKDEIIVQEIQNLIRKYEIGRIKPPLNRVVHQVSRKRRKNKELHLNAHIRDYDIDYVVLDLGSEVNVMTIMIYSPIRLRMANQQVVSPFGILDHVPVHIHEVRMFADFEVIEIVDESCPYPTLLGIDWDFNNSTMVNLKKIRMTFEGDGLRVIALLDPDEGRIYTKSIREEDRAYELENIYKLTSRQQNYINPTTNGNLSWRSDNAFSSYLEEALEN
jgi:hypothetical protein